ncbi:MAG: class IV adenylate cyclase [Acidilobus sp.]
MDHVEVEVKLRVPCEALDEIAKRSSAAGGSVEPPVDERDVYYEHPCRDLMTSDEALRVRYVNGLPLSLTYKGPRGPGDLKSREEVIVEVKSDPDKLLRLLGFTPSIEVRKRRTYISLGFAEVTLDVVEDLGCFVEVETANSDANEVRRTLELLNIKGEAVAQTYAELIAKIRRETNAI